MESLLKDKLYKEFLAQGFVEFDGDPTRPEPKGVMQLRSKFSDIDSMAFAYAIVIIIHDLHRIPNYPKHMKRFNYEAHVSYIASYGDGEQDIPQTQIHYVVTSVKQATDHAYRLWNALGRTTE